MDPYFARFLRTPRPLFAPDKGDGGGGGADPDADAPAGDVDAGDLSGDDFMSLFEDDEGGAFAAADDDLDDDESQPDDDLDDDAVDADDAEAFMDEAMRDPLGLGLDDEGDAGDEDEKDKAEAEPKDDEGKDGGEGDGEPEALPASFMTRLQEAVPDAVLDSPDAVVERLRVTDEANREMRTLQDAIDAATERDPELEKILTAVIAAPGEDGRRPSLRELIATHVDGVAIADLDAVADPEEAAKRAEEKGRVAAVREAQAKKAREDAAYKAEYGRRTEGDFETFAADHFAGEDGEVDEAQSERFLRTVVRIEKGDPATGRLMRPLDKFNLYYRGLTYDQAVKAAYEKGKTEAAAARGKGGRGRRGAPKLGNAGGGRSKGPDPLGLGDGNGRSIHDEF